MPERVLCGTLTVSETRRKLVHVAVGGFAFLLRWLTWPQALAMAAAAFAFNWKVLPRVGGRGLWRDADRDCGYPLGILLYPAAVFFLILLFREDLWMAAVLWGVLAFGDGMATIVGRAAGGPRLFWNPDKGWGGFLAFLVCGTVGAAALMVWTLGLPLASAAAPRIMALVAPLVLICAWVESLPTTLDDNLTIPLVGSAALVLLARLDPWVLFADPEAPRRLAIGLGVNAVIAVAAWLARSIDPAGALSAIAVGTAITVGVGLPGLAVMIAFFVIGTTATKLGYRIKLARGIAQEKGGARGWRNAWANGGVPALLGLAAGMAPGIRELLAVAYAAAVATAAADTCSSEVGKAYGRRTFLITTLKPVPPGTEGAVSLEGTLGGVLGGVLVGAVGALVGLYAWPTALLVGLAGTVGSLAESVIGTVAERKGWMGNDLLNALNTAIGAAVMALLFQLEKTT